MLQAIKPDFFLRAVKVRRNVSFLECIAVSEVRKIIFLFLWGKLIINTHYILRSSSSCVFASAAPAHPRLLLIVACSLLLVGKDVVHGLAALVHLKDVLRESIVVVLTSSSVDLSVNFVDRVAYRHP